MEACSCEQHSASEMNVADMGCTVRHKQVLVCDPLILQGTRHHLTGIGRGVGSHASHNITLSKLRDVESEMHVTLGCLTLTTMSAFLHHATSCLTRAHARARQRCINSCDNCLEGKRAGAERPLSAKEAWHL